MLHRICDIGNEHIMFDNLIIENFQSHKKSELEFHSGVNVIVGQSDSGKTAVLRALNWVINNKPSGESFRSHWGGVSFVKLESDNCAISRIRDKSNNKYVLDTESNNEEYKAMGQTVPGSISAILNMQPINFQRQMDGPFLLSMNSGEVGRYLNNIVNLEEIDVSLKKTASWIRQYSRSVEELKDIEKDLTDTLKEPQYTHLNEMSTAVKRMGCIETKFDKINDDRYSLECLIQDIQNHAKKLSVMKDVDKADRKFIKIEKMQASTQTKQNTCTQLQNYITQIQQYEDGISKYTTDIAIIKDQIEDLILQQEEDNGVEICRLCGQEIKNV